MSAFVLFISFDYRVKDERADSLRALSGRVRQIASHQFRPRLVPPGDSPFAPHRGIRIEEGAPGFGGVACLSVSGVA